MNYSNYKNNYSSDTGKGNNGKGNYANAGNSKGNYTTTDNGEFNFNMVGECNRYNNVVHDVKYTNKIIYNTNYTRASRKTSFCSHYYMDTYCKTAKPCVVPDNQCVLAHNTTEFVVCDEIYEFEMLLHNKQY